MRVQAKYEGAVIAESSRTIVVEGNHYFPPEDVHKEYLKESPYTTVCPWKGTASYYHVEVQGELSENAAWYYPEPKEKALHIKDYVAFGKEVEVVNS